MNFDLISTVSDKWIKVTDLLDEARQYQSKECKKDVPKKWKGYHSSGSDNNAGLVKVEVSRDDRDYHLHFERLDVYEGGDPVEIDDSHLPKSGGQG